MFLPTEATSSFGDHSSIRLARLRTWVLLDGNPLADIRNSQRILAVIVNGKLLDRVALDRLLGEAKRTAQKN